MKINITTALPTFTAENINHYSTMNWQKVCKVNPHNNHWYYSEINKDLMFSDHRSWVYAITVDQKIAKIGETGQPLGIEGARNYNSSTWEIQPKTGTQSRLGRYRKGDGTDERIRESLNEAVNTAETSVEIYVVKCPTFSYQFNLNDKTVPIKSAIHKDLEKVLLDYYVANTGKLPPLNPNRA